MPRLSEVYSFADQLQNMTSWAGCEYDEDNNGFRLIFHFRPDQRTLRAVKKYMQPVYLVTGTHYLPDQVIVTFKMKEEYIHDD